MRENHYVLFDTRREKVGERLGRKGIMVCKKLLISRHKNIEIDIELRKNIKCDADVVSGDEDREYIMRVRRGLKEDDILTSVFHEMVHIKQDLRKEHKLFDCTDIPYLDRPWEQEAYELQETMLVAYRKEEKVAPQKNLKRNDVIVPRANLDTVKIVFNNTDHFWTVNALGTFNGTPRYGFKVNTRLSNLDRLEKRTR